MKLKLPACAAALHLANHRRMSEASLHPQTAANPPALNPDDVFWLLGDPSRRRVLLALHGGAALAASQLRDTAGLQQSATEKHLTSLLKAGLVVAAPDEQDKRRMLYRLSPSVAVVKTGTGAALDFGCCLVRLDN